ncbi:mitochondrial 39-S ribosomal protein L47 (MRP-L47)-domain-containing protein [Russula dissimulans]|nr:mitochondrial 39-S ribosomal protein L47 (MRP-L47)-domain-containing protein [Russula dissimulans]
MLSFFRTRTANAVCAFRHVRRYSTPIDVIPKAGETSAAPGALRPHLNIPVNPNHGLYAFFRRREKEGKITHDPFEDDSGLQDVFGRAWSAAELRRKSFRDLHTLWYVLLRERNLLKTQRETYRRAGVGFDNLNTVQKRDHQCRKSMARIKYVINERRLGYEGAMKIHAEKSEQASKEKEGTGETEKGSSADVGRQEREASPPVSEAAQVAVDSLLHGSTNQGA